MDGVFIRLQKPQARRGPWRMNNKSRETVQDAQRGKNRQPAPGGEYFVYFWTGLAATTRFAVAAS